MVNENEMIKKLNCDRICAWPFRNIAKNCNIFRKSLYFKFPQNPSFSVILLLIKNAF